MHLSSQDALDLLDGLTEAEQAAAINTHLTQCVDCRRFFEEWRQVHSRLGRTHLTNAPQQLLKKAETIFEPPRQAALATIRQVVASLVFDSFAQPAFAGARGGADARQVVLRAENFDVHVKIFGDPTERQLIGQIFARNEASFPNAARLHLLQNGERVGMTMLDQFGGFQFEEIPAGALSLQIDLPHLTVVGALN
jgi:hypothetical protein